MKTYKILIPILTLFTLFTLTACSGSSNSSGTIIQSRMGSGASAAAAKEAVESTELQSDDNITGDLYIINKLDTDRSTVSFSKVNGGKQTEYGYTLGTQFLNKYGTSKSITSFMSGDVVTIEVSDSTKKLLTVALSDKVWVNDDIRSFSIDTERSGLTIGKTKYAYDESLLVYSGDTPTDLGAVSSQDILKAVGIDKKLISVSIVQGHGYLTLSNTELFDNSFICVGNKIFEQVEPEKEIEVPEGNYVVTVANDGYGGSKEVTITRGEHTLLDLNELKGEGPKFCKITFEIGIEGAALTIDGQAVDYSQPTEVRYGIHAITVSAAGYDTISQKLVVNSADATIQIGLTEESDSKSTTDSNSGSSSNSSGSNNNTNNSTSNTTNNNTNNSSNNNSNTNNNSNNTNSSNSTNNSSTNTDSNSNSSSSTDLSSTDYLTTLYNLLNSINSDDIKDQ